MTDTISKERRSWTMRRIKIRDTKPEMIVRRYLFSRVLRYRVNVKRVLGHHEEGEAAEHERHPQPLPWRQRIPQEEY